MRRALFVLSVLSVLSLVTAATLDFKGRLTITGKNVSIQGTIVTNGDDYGTPTTLTNNLKLAMLWTNSYRDSWGTNHGTAVGTVVFTNAGPANYPMVLHLPYDQANYVKTVHTLSSFHLGPTTPYTWICFFRLADTNTLHGLGNLRAAAFDGNGTDIQMYYTPIDLGDGHPNCLHVGVGSVSAATTTDVAVLWTNGFGTNWMMGIAMHDVANGKMIGALFGRGADGAFSMQWNTNTWANNNNGTITNFYFGLGWPPAFGQYGTAGQLGPQFIWHDVLTVSNCIEVAYTNGPGVIQGKPWPWSGSMNPQPPDTNPPIVQISVPTTSPTYATSNSSITLGGDLYDNVGVTSFSWTNALTQQSAAIDITASTWSLPGLMLQFGTNPITVRAADAAGNVGTDTITITSTNQPPPPPGGYFVSPTGGTTGASGSTNQPWSLVYAMAGAQTNSVNRIQPGDHIWIRGGHYTNAWYTNTVGGTFVSNVVFEAYPHEDPIVWMKRSSPNVFLAQYDHVLRLAAHNVRIIGLNFRGANYDMSDFVNGPVSPAAVTSDTAATNVGIINCTFRDTGEGIAFTNYRLDNFLSYGNWYQNTGVDYQDHATYWHNISSAFMRSSNEVLIGSHTSAHQPYSGNQFQTQNFSFDDGVVFATEDRHFFVGNGDGPIANVHLRNNIWYYPPGAGAENNNVGNSPSPNPCTGLIFSNNWTFGGSTAANFKFFTGSIVRSNVVFNLPSGGGAQVMQYGSASYGSSTVNDNRYYGSDTSSDFSWSTSGSFSSGNFASYKAATGLDSVSTLTTSAPSSPWVRVVTNVYETGATITIVNFGTNNTVSVDMSGVFGTGDNYSIAPGFNLDTPCLTGTYGGGSLSFPMTNMVHIAPVASRPFAARATDFYENLSVGRKLWIMAFRARKTN